MVSPLRLILLCAAALTLLAAPAFGDEEVRVSRVITTKPVADITPEQCDGDLPMFSESKAAAVHLACFLRTAAQVNLDGDAAGAVLHGYNSWLAPNLYVAWHNHPELAIGIRDGFVPVRIEHAAVGEAIGMRTVLFGCVVSVRGDEQRRQEYMFMLGGAPQRKLSGRKDGHYINLVGVAKVQKPCA